MNLKLSKTAIRELTKRYRAVLLAAVAASAFVATGAKAANEDKTIVAKDDTTEYVVDITGTGSAITNKQLVSMTTLNTYMNMINDSALSGMTIEETETVAQEAKLVSAGQVKEYVTGKGYQTSDDVSSAISTALANGENAYQTASDVASAISGKANTADLGSAAAADVLSGTIAGNTTSNDLVSASQVTTYFGTKNTAIGEDPSNATGLFKDVEDLNTALSGKQATIDGDHKLSADLVDDSSATNKFVTAAEKTKLSGIETGAEVNVIETIKVGTTEKTVTDKTVTLGTAADANVLSGTIAENTTSNDLVSASQVVAYAQSAQQVEDAIDAAAGAGLATNSLGKLSVDLADKSGLSLGAGDSGKLSVNLADGTIVKDNSTGALKVGTIAQSQVSGLGDALDAKQDTLTAGNGISIDTSTDTISVAGLTTTNFADGVIKTSVGPASGTGAASDSALVTEKAVRTALDTKTDLVDTYVTSADPAVTYQSKVDVDAHTSRTITLEVTRNGETQAGILVDGDMGYTNVSGALNVQDGRFAVQKDTGSHTYVDVFAVEQNGTLSATGLKTEVNTSDSTKIDVTLGTAGSTTTVLGNEVVDGTLTATTLKAGNNGTALTNGQLSLGDGTYAANLKAVQDGSSANSLLQVSTGLQIGGATGATLKDSTSALTVSKQLVDEAGFKVNANNTLTSTGLTASSAKIAGSADVGAYDDGSSTSYALQVAARTDATTPGSVTANEKFYAKAGADITGDSQVTGDLVVTSATANQPRFIATEEGTIHLQTWDSTGSGEYVDTFGVDANGNITKAGTINATGLKTEVNSSDSSKIDVKLGTAGSTTTVLGNEVVNGSLKIGGAEPISGEANVLHMGNNSLDNVKGLTLTTGTDGQNVDLTVTHTDSGDLLNIGSVFKVNDTTGAVVAGDLDATGIKTVGGDTKTVDLGGSGYTTTATGTFVVSDGATPTANKATLTATDKGLNIAEGLTVATNKFIVEKDGDTTVGGTLKIGGAEAITGTDHTLNMAANTLKNTAGLTVGSAGNETFTLGSNGALAIGENLTDSNNKVVNFSVDANGDTKTKGQLTADGRSMFGQYTDTSSGSSVTKYALDVTSSAVTANQVVEALAGVKFGSDTTAMNNAHHSGAVTADSTGQGQVVASVQSIADTRAAINTDMIDVLGSMYSVSSSSGADVSYNKNALTNSMFKTYDSTEGSLVGAADLTASLGNLATNLNSITGGAIAADGTVNNNYKVVDDDGNPKVVYATSKDMDVKTSLAQAVGQIANNIGADMTSAGRTTVGVTAAGNSVNANLTAIDTYLGGDVSGVARTTGAVGNTTVKANLEALDAAIGTDTDLLTTTVSTAAGDNNGVAVSNSVNRNISALNAAVGDISKLSYDDTDTKSKGNALVNRDEEGHVTGRATTVVEALNNVDATLGTIHGLNAKRGTNAKGNLATGTTVEQHLVALDDAIGDRSQFARSHYMKANAPVANAMMDLDYNLHRVEKELKGGFASVAALSALQPNARAAGDTQISMGAGAYRDHQGLALGAFHYFNDNVLANVGASYAGDKSTMFRAGVTFGW